MSLLSALDVSHNVCFESIANRRRFNYSGVISPNGESSCMASSFNGCDKPDRFLPTLTSKIPLHATSQTSRYAAELLALVAPVCQPPRHSGDSSDPTLLPRLYYSQSLNVNVPVPSGSRYSARHNASSRPAHIFFTGPINEWALHPCAWSRQNFIAAIIDGAVYAHEGSKWDIITSSIYSATSLEWLTDHTLLIGDEAGTVVAVDINTGQETINWIDHYLSPSEKASISSLSFSRERHTIAAGRLQGNLTLYDSRTNNHEHHERLLPAGISTVRWSPEGRWLAVGGPDGSVTCVDLEAGKNFSLTLPNQKQPPHKGPATSLAWAPWDPYLLATGGTGKDGTVHLWSLSGSDKSSRPYRHVQTSQFSARVSSLHFSPHTDELLLTYGKPLKEAIEAPLPPQGILVHKYPSFKCVHAVNAHNGPIVDSVLSADGTSLLTFGMDERLKTWKIWGERKKERLPTRMGISIIR